MSTRKAEATWEGDLLRGHGSIRIHNTHTLHGGFGQYSFGTRMEGQPGTNPEELIAAAHAGCFSMAFAAGLAKIGHVPKRVHTVAEVHLDKGEQGHAISRIVLHTDGIVPGCSENEFKEQAEIARKNCPVSRAMTGTNIELTAKLFV